MLELCPRVRIFKRPGFLSKSYVVYKKSELIKLILRSTQILLTMDGTKLYKNNMIYNLIILINYILWENSQ